MVDVATVNVMQNGFRNVILRVTLFSDGSGITNQKIFDASSTGAFGVNRAGQIFYPGIHTKVRAIDYDIQDMKMRVQWEAAPSQDIFPLGNAPEDFDWTRMGGLPVPPGLAGATGSILLTSINQAPQSTFFMTMYLTKNV